MTADASIRTAGTAFPLRSSWSVPAMLILALVWGLSIPVTKLGLATMPPLTLTALRFAIAVPVFMLFGVKRLLLPCKAVPKVAALGILGIGIGQVAQTFGIAGTSASVSTIVECTEAQVATITGHTLSEVKTILDSTYLSRDYAMAEAAIAKLEARTENAKRTSKRSGGSEVTEEKT